MFINALPLRVQINVKAKKNTTCNYNVIILRVHT